MRTDESVWGGYREGNGEGKVATPLHQSSFQPGKKQADKLSGLGLFCLGVGVLRLFAEALLVLPSLCLFTSVITSSLSVDQIWYVGFILTYYNDSFIHFEYHNFVVYSNAALENIFNTLL